MPLIRNASNPKRGSAPREHPAYASANVFIFIPRVLAGFIATSGEFLASVVHSLNAQVLLRFTADSLMSHRRGIGVHMATGG